jgi:SAM-dependent methyltransferase
LSIEYSIDMEHEVYHLFSEIQATHWWFVARRRIIADVLQRFLKTSAPQRIAEIGCGTGAMLPVLAQFGEAWGIDNSPDAVALCARKNFPRVYLDNDPAWRRTQFEGMAFFDVIEHVPDDAAFMKNYLAQLQPGGWAVITVPAFMFLWSEHDVLNQHYRRYRAPQLQRVIAAAGLRLERTTYFNTFLFPAIAAARFATKTLRALARSPRDNGAANLRTDFERNLSFFNPPLQALFASERFVLRRCNFPFGTSLLALARKPIAAPVALSTGQVESVA